MALPPPGATTSTGADALVATLAAHGVDAIYINPGTDTAPVQEAVRRAREGERPAPSLVLCTHEIVALAAAHAHFAVSGRVQAVLVHVDVGTQNLGSGIHNAARAEAGVIVLAGRTPVDELATRPGGRDRTVHWLQDVPDQHGIVRPYMKATFDVGDPGQMSATIGRAIRVAQSIPSGPVYVTLPREALMAMTTTPVTRPSAVPLPPGPTREGVALSVAALRAARRPLVVTARAGRDSAAVDLLVRLVERIGARVLDQRERMNFPADHPALVRDPAEEKAAWAAADLVIAIDAPVPWVPSVMGPAEDATVLLVDADPVHATMPNWGHRVDIGITSSPAEWLGAVLGELGDGSAIDTARVARAPKAAADGAGRLDPAAFLSELGEHVSADDILIDEASTNAALVARHIPRTRAGTLLRSGGSGLGFGLGALLGVGIALPDADALTIVGDGGFLFGTPLAALLALRSAGVGGLIVVLQNGGYAASSRPVHQLFPERGPSAGQPLATEFGSDLGLDDLARACGAVGYTVRSSADLEPVVKAAVDEWRAGGLVLLGARITSPWIGASDSR